MKNIDHFINGNHFRGNNKRHGDVFNPATGEKIAEVPFANASEVDNAVNSAIEGQKKWSDKNHQQRARVIDEFVRIINADINNLAELLSSEHGKTIPDSIGDIQRGIEVMEFVCGIPHLLKGEYTVNAGRGIDMYSMRQPLGVVAGITPFNFPAMIPMWKLGPAIACGNSFILKPSEKNPSVPVRLAEMMIEAGLPAGVFNVLNGDKETVDAILEHKHISAIGFVGSTPVAHYVYAKACSHGKRAQCFGGAKNHMVIMPDADMDKAVNSLIGAGFGSAGERCMAISVAVPVGDETADILRDKLVASMKNLHVGNAGNSKTDFGPLISKQHHEKVSSYVDKGVAEGADLIVDGRKVTVSGHENGYYMGACLFDNVTSKMSIYRDEIFGPVLSMVRAKDYTSALSLINDCNFGNGVAIFTRDGDTARDFSTKVTVGMVGINVPLPVPLAYYSFGGWKSSSFGDLNQHGPDSIRFYSRLKTVTSRWPGGHKEKIEFSLPSSASIKPSD